MKVVNDNNILHLFKNPEAFDPIHSRLCSVADLLNNYEEDVMLELVQNKVLEAIDWYERYLDHHGLLEERQKEDKQGKIE